MDESVDDKARNLLTLFTVLPENMWPFSQKKSIPQGPIAEHPDDTDRSLMEVLVDGLTIHRAKHADTRLLVSWQGQAGRVDSYHIEDAHIDKGILSFDHDQFDFAQLQRLVDINLEPLLSHARNSLDVSSLDPERVAGILEQAFVGCLKVKPFEDSGGYSLGVELDPMAESDVDTKA
ncbi:MAG: hypothetical protein LW645_08520 [Verrucomicrobiaceae bacterium]|nr:hypothetical protein [Verrucomicrobiaceae bacterium]